MVMNKNNSKDSVYFNNLLFYAINYFYLGLSKLI